MLLKVDRISQHAFLSALITPDSTVIDLGANNGEFCLEVARRYGCKVLAAEPVPELAGALQGRDARVTVLPVAVGGDSGTTSITYDLGKDKTGSILGLSVVGSLLDDEAARRAATVEVRSLESFLSLSPSEIVDLLKVDIEGAELDAFSSVSDAALKRCRQITVEFHDFWYPDLSTRTEQVKRRIVDAGFSLVRFTPNNKDVLFINRSLVPVSELEFFLLRYATRNVMGFARMCSLGWRRLVGRA